VAPNYGKVKVKRQRIKLGHGEPVDDWCGQVVAYSQPRAVSKQRCIGAKGLFAYITDNAAGGRDNRLP